MSPLLTSSIDLSRVLADDRASVATNGNVNEVSIGDADADRRQLVAYFPYLIRFSAEGEPVNAIGQYEGLAAIFLAAEHLNTGNGTIVRELEGINERCPLKFTTKAYDTEKQASVGVNHVIALTDRSQTNENELLPTAFLGAAASGISMPTSIVSGLRGFPQISPISTSAALDDKSKYRQFGRTIPNDDGTAVPLLAKLSEWGVRCVAVLHLDNDYGNGFAKGMRVAAENDDAVNLQVRTLDIVPGADGAEISEAIATLKTTECMYFFGIFNPPDFADAVMVEAYNQGIAGDGLHTWMFSDSFGDTVTRRGFERDSPLERAYRGTGLLSAVGGVPGMEKYDLLSESLRQIGQSEEDRALLEDHLPSDRSDGLVVDHTAVTNRSTFLAAPGLIASFLYDAAVSLGLSSCSLMQESETNGFSGEDLFRGFLNTSIEGTSGSMVINPKTGTRDPRSALFSLTNFVEDEEKMVETGEVWFKGVGTDIFRSGQWESLSPYLFNDGTTKLPPDLSAIQTNTNYINTPLIIVGLILCAIIVCLASIFAGWTYRYRDKRIVRSSQPLFLYIIIGGTLLMGLSIISLTVYAGVGNKQAADAACMSTPWLLATGFSMIFSALFSKTRRVYKVVQSALRFRRVKIKRRDVIRPMVALLLINTIVLIVWTVIDPLERKDVVVTQDPFLRNTETFPTCNSEHEEIFLGILCSINLGCLLYALFQSYRARHISTELQESSYIFSSIALVSLVSLIGIPVIIIARDNIAAFYFVTVGLIFVTCASILLLIFVPKMQAMHPVGEVPAIGSGITNGPVIRRGSADSASIAAASGLGIEILSSPQVQAQLEQEIRDLKRLLATEEGCQKCNQINSAASQQAQGDVVAVSQERARGCADDI